MRPGRLFAVGLLLLADAETGHQMWVDTSDPTWQAAFQAQTSTRQDAHLHALRQARIETLTMSTADDILLQLVRFLHQRAGRRK